MSTLDRATLRSLSERSPLRWVAAAAFDWAIIVATFVAVRRLDHPAAYALAIIALGSRQQALGALFHDAAHHLVTRSRMWNDVLGGPLSAWPLGLTLAGYRRYHLVHHRALGTARDPEIAHRRALRHWSLPLRPHHALYFVSDLLGAGVPHLMAAGKLTRPVRARETLGMVLFWGLLIALAAWLGLLWVVALWVASIVTAFWSGVRLRIFTEHLGTLGTHRIEMHPLFEAVVMPHSIGLHWEHHHFPSVPFYRLRALRTALPSPPPIELLALMRRMTHCDALASGEVGATVGKTPRSLDRSTT